MGEIKKLLAMGEVEPRSVTPGGIWTDLCENVHLHYRNNRFDFSEVEFAGFRAAINMLGLAVEKTAHAKGYREGDPNYLIHISFDVPLKTDSDYYPNRILIELQRDNTVHFHYRDLRLHFSLAEFKAIGNLFIEAMGAMLVLEDPLLRAEFPHKDATTKIRAWVDINLIQPYDAGHRALAIDKDHRDGIEHVKGLINEGKKIRPILVDTRGQRLDGFKRYMAQLELGFKEIECIIDPFGVMGGQHNQSLEDDRYSEAS